VVLATSQDGARKRKGSPMKHYSKPRPDPYAREEFLALLILLGPARVPRAVGLASAATNCLLDYL
jgi:hypothetical protein